MKTLFTLLLIAFFPRLVVGQISAFQQSYGGINDDMANSILSLGDNGYLIFGTTNNFNSNGTDLLLTRINSEGAVLWMNRYGGALNENAEHVELTADGGYILLANTTTFGAGNNDLLVIKTDANGTVSWSRTFGGSRNDFAACIKQVPDNGYIIAGRTQSFGRGGDDGYLIKIDNQGNILWSNAYGTNNNERFYYIDNASNSGFVITGIENSSSTSRYDVLVIRTDRNGNILSNNSFGDRGGPANDASDCIRSTPDGGYAFSGHYQSYGSGGLDLAITKVDANGQIEWARVFGDTGDERAWDFQIDGSNNYILTGYTTSYGNGRNEALGILINSNGIPQWTRTYGGRANEEFNECIINGNSIAFVGYTESIGAGRSDFYVVKTDFSGNSTDGCLAQTNLIRNSSIMPLARTINQVRTNLNQLTLSRTITITELSINLNNITITNPCFQPTPVKLIDFSVYSENENNILNWKTSSEINTDLFVIEQSLDGEKFDSIGFCKATNGGESFQEYKYLLPLTNYSNIYFRLKIIDYDGYKEYSRIIYLYNENIKFNIYPTYFKNSFQVQPNINNNSILNIEITDINGIEYYRKKYSAHEIVSINTEQWPTGIFIIRITSIDGKEHWVKKIIKE